MAWNDSGSRNPFILPVGLSHLARLNLPQTGGAVSVMAAAALLAALSLALILWLYSRGVKRLFNR